MEAFLTLPHAAAPCSTPASLVGASQFVGPRAQAQESLLPERVHLVTLAAGLAALAGTRRRSSRTSQGARSAAKSEGWSLTRADLVRGLGGTLALRPETALAKSKDEAVEELKKYGVPELIPTEDAPDGWSWVVEPIGLTADAYYGKNKMGGEPQVLLFLTPPFWVLTRPNLDYNGAAGTVSINNYGKGDSATLFVDTKFKGQLDTMKTADWVKEVTKAVSQKGGDQIFSVKVQKVTDGAAPGYKQVEFTYVIESGAGFEFERTAVAAASQVSSEGHLQIFWASTLTNRWREEAGKTARTIASSFRLAKVPENVKIENRYTKKEFVPYDQEVRNPKIRRVGED
eukprot:TRINITY_DN62025_c0_g1_i1.p1 TRINITY_DN62025_c0_g1~~TRINITY_DN62025_c0_g1_i1.p1  ORF type:complete len:366 (-),score=72.04 TRINITY_DN62025_c0_g1_i1:291-1319(-)